MKRNLHVDALHGSVCHTYISFLAHTISLHTRKKSVTRIDYRNLHFHKHVKNIGSVGVLRLGFFLARAQMTFPNTRRLTITGTGDRPL